MFVNRSLNKILFCALLCIHSVAIASLQQNNYYRSYWNPLYKGERLAYCSLNQRECGLPVANHYCQIMGYEKAARQIIDYNVGLTHFLATKSQCKGWTCNGFMLIRCVSNMKHQPPNAYYYRAKKFVFPRFERHRVAWCYQNNQECGRRAAFSFCRRMGYTRELHYEKQVHVLATRELSDKKLCFGDACNGFSSITCYR